MTASAAKNGGNGATLDTTALAQLADEVIQQLQRGEKVAPSVLVSRYPEHAEKLCELLPAIQALADLSQSGDGKVPLGEDPLQDSADRPGKNRELGDFRILRQIGRGGMGIVYEAEQISLRRRVALKILPLAGALDQRHLVRFKNESLAAAALQHPHIVPVYAVGCERGIHYYAMQYVGGQNLAELIRELRIREGLDERQDDANDETPAHVRQVSTDPQSVPDLTSEFVNQEFAAESTLISRKGSSTQRSRQERTAYYRNIARLGLQAAEALAHAHEEGVIHRDIKPSNLLLDAHGQLWVTDFGLARTKSDAGVTLTGDLLGTLRYMSPEQAQAKRIPVDHRTDIYSLGATLYELLTLRPMFAGDNQAELLRKITFDDPLPPRRLRGDFPLDLETILLKSVEKDPRERYATARELADELGRYLDNAPILARRPTIRQSALRWCRRHRGVVTGLALVLVAWLVIGSGSWWWVTQERFHRQQETLTAVSKALAEAQAQKTKADAANAAEKKANEELQKRLQQINRGNEIIAGIFEDLDINAIKNRDEALEQVLAQRLIQAAKKLDEESVGSPLVTAALQQRLGNALNGLGYLAPAIAIHEKAVAIFKASLGPEHTQTLGAINSLAIAYKDAGQLDKALPLFEATLKARKAILGLEHPNTLTSTNNLACAYLDAGKLNHAVPLLEATLKGQQATMGSDDLRMLTTMENLAMAYKDTGKLTQALALLEETLRIRKAKLRPVHPHTLTTMLNLAGVYDDLGRLEDAISLYEQILPAIKKARGPNHPHTVVTMSNLAAAYKGVGKFDQALPMFEQLVPMFKSTFGENHPNTLVAKNNLAAAYLKVDKPDQAVPLLEIVLKAQKAKLGPDHPLTLVTASNLASAYQEAGKLDQALPILEQTLQTVTDKLGPNHRNTLAIMSNLAEAYLAAKRIDEAITLFEQSLAGYRTELGPDHPLALSALNNVAWAYQLAGNVDQALQMFEKSAVGVENRKFQDLGAGFIIFRTVAAYEAAKQFDHAETWRRKWLAVVKEKNGAESPVYGEELAPLGLNLVNQQKWTEAEPVLRECLAIREKSKPDDWRTCNTRSMLGGALLGQQNYTEAEPLLLAGYQGLKEREKTMPPLAAPRISEALDRLIQLYTDTNKPDEAEKWRAEREALSSATPPVSNEKPRR